MFLVDQKIEATKIGGIRPNKEEVSPRKGRIHQRNWKMSPRMGGIHQKMDEFIRIRRIAPNDEDVIRHQKGENRF